MTLGTNPPSANPKGYNFLTQITPRRPPKAQAENYPYQPQGDQSFFSGSGLGTFRLNTDNYDYGDLSGILGSRVSGGHQGKTRSVTWEHANAFGREMDEKWGLIDYNDSVVKQNEAENKVLKAIEERERVNSEIALKKRRSGFKSVHGEG
jgi:hypothetical protein